MGAELPVELSTRARPVTKIRYRWVCERPFDLLLNLGTLSKVTIYIYPAEPMGTVLRQESVSNGSMRRRALLKWHC